MDSPYSKKAERKLKRKPKSSHLVAVAEVLQGLLQSGREELSNGFLRWRLEQEWPQIVGPSMAEQTVPCGFERGVLYIWVRNSTWLNELHYLKKEVRDKVNAHLKTTWAKDVQFTLNRKAAVTAPGTTPD